MTTIPTTLREHLDAATYQRMCDRYRELGQFCNGIMPTKLDQYGPAPSEVREFGNDLRLLAKKVDALIADAGQYLEHHTGYKVDQSLFRDQLEGALEGNALYEVDCAADELTEVWAEAAQ